MYNLLYDFFYSLFDKGTGGTTYGIGLDEIHFQIGNIESVAMDDWLCHTFSIISMIFIVVLCCMFVYKIVKLIGGLIR